jgi:hypothetical protein
MTDKPKAKTDVPFSLRLPDRSDPFTRRLFRYVDRSQREASPGHLSQNSVFLELLKAGLDAREAAGVKP